MSKQEIGQCPYCKSAIYTGEPRRGIWHAVLPRRIERTCQCFNVLLSSAQWSLLHNSMMPCALALMPIREFNESDR